MGAGAGLELVLGSLFGALSCFGAAAGFASGLLALGAGFGACSFGALSFGALALGALSFLGLLAGCTLSLGAVFSLGSFACGAGLGVGFDACDSLGCDSERLGLA